MSKLCDATSLEMLDTLFPSDDDVIDKLDFTVLHKTVVGLGRIDLRSLLESLPKSIIDQGDRNGRSAAWWAAARGDASALSLLISFDADVDKMAPNGGKPLDAATDIVEHLIDNGAIIDARNGNGSTPFHLASQAGKAHLIRHLLSKGANPNPADAMGVTPLHLAIGANRSHVVNLMLRHGADVTLQTCAGETVLHYAAHLAHAECLCVLALFDLAAVSAGSRVSAGSQMQQSDLRGLTALEIAGRRKDVGPEWLPLFQKLVCDIRFSWYKSSREDRVEFAERFEDALEYQGGDIQS